MQPIRQEGYPGSGKGVRMYKGMWVPFADFISIFLNIPNRLWIIHEMLLISTSSLDTEKDIYMVK